MKRPDCSGVAVSAEVHAGAGRFGGVCALLSLVAEEVGLGPEEILVRLMLHRHNREHLVGNVDIFALDVGDGDVGEGGCDMHIANYGLWQF